MADEIKIIVDFFSSLGVVGILATLAIPSLKKKVWGNGNGASHEDIKQQLSILENNHLHGIMEGINDLKAIEKDEADDRREMMNEQKQQTKLLYEIAGKIK